MTQPSMHITVTVTTIDGKVNDHQYDLPGDMDGIVALIASVTKSVVDPLAQKTPLALGNPNLIYNPKYVVSVAINAGTAESDEPIFDEVKRQIGFVQTRS